MEVWGHLVQEKLTINHRLRGASEEWIETLESAMTGQDPQLLLPETVVIPYHNDKSEKLADLISFVFPTLEDRHVFNHRILTPLNKDVTSINNLITERYPGRPITLHSVDIVADESRDVPIEFLNNLVVSGLPPHELIMKVGMPVMMLRNFQWYNITRSFCRYEDCDSRNKFGYFCRCHSLHT
jgi:hypothetical protein